MNYTLIATEEQIKKQYDLMRKEAYPRSYKLRIQVAKRNHSRFLGYWNGAIVYLQSEIN